MICPICQVNQATYHITDIALPDQSFDLCNECKNYFSQTDLFCKNLDDLKKSLHQNKNDSENRVNFLNFGASKEFITNIFDENSSCPHCGGDLTKILTSGIINCPEEYDTYGTMLDKIFLEIFQTSQYKGKPYSSSLAGQKLAKITSLEFDLQKAIESENYELAGELTKKLKEIKQDEA